jgi:DnaJ-class molecular chaperone
MLPAQWHLVKCPNCNGTGDRNRRVEFRQGTVGAWASRANREDECGRCRGDGAFYEPANVSPPSAG